MTIRNGVYFLGDVLGDVEASLGIKSRQVDLGSPVIFLKFLKTSLGLAISPHTCRHPDALSLIIKSLPDNWRWISSEGRDFLQDPKWKHAGRIGRPSGASSKALHTVGKCKNPLYVASEVAESSSYGIQSGGIGAPALTSEQWWPQHASSSPCRGQKRTPRPS